MRAKRSGVRTKWRARWHLEHEAEDHGSRFNRQCLRAVSPGNRAREAPYARGGNQTRGTDQARGQSGARAHDHGEPASGGEAGHRLREPRTSAARSCLGGQHRPDESRRALRSGKRRQAEHLRRVVDQAIDQARAGQPKQNNPRAGAPGGEDCQDPPPDRAPDPRTGARSERRGIGRRGRVERGADLVAEKQRDPTGLVGCAGRPG